MFFLSGVGCKGRPHVMTFATLDERARTAQVLCRQIAAIVHSHSVIVTHSHGHIVAAYIDIGGIAGATNLE